MDSFLHFLNSIRIEILAALIQGVCILFTGICALFAGKKAYKAATNQTLLYKQKEEKRHIAYRFMIKEIVSVFIEKLEANITIKNEQCIIPGMLLPIVKIPEELDTKNWESLALLEKDEISSIVGISSILEKNSLFVKSSYLKYHTSECSPLNKNPEIANQQDDLERSGNLRVIEGMREEDFHSNLDTIISSLKKLRESLSVNKHKDYSL